MKKIVSLGILYALIVLFVIIQPASALENSWMSRPPMLEPAGKAVAVDGKIYAIGAITQEYDPVALTWTKKASIPNPTGGGIAVYQNKIYVIGDRYNDVYDVATNTWASKTAMPTNRIGIQANVVGDKIYLIGGASDAESGTILDVNEVYDPVTDTWTTKEPIPTPVYLYASAVVDHKIYIIGGSAEPPNIVLDSVQIYDPENDSWTTGTPMPTAVRYASAAATTGLFAPKRIYVIGGLQSGSGLNLNQVYNPQTDSWTTGTSMPTARYDLGVAVVNDTIYAMGGVLLPPYAFPKEPLTTNEAYLPMGYEGPLPPYWGPTPSPSISPSVSPSPTPTPTLHPTSTPTSSSSPSTPPESDTLSVESVLIATTVVATVIAGAVAVGTGLLILYNRKRQRLTTKA
jgi:N-acetylneuraminic acid mutarotase